MDAYRDNVKLLKLPKIMKKSVKMRTLQPASSCRPQSCCSATSPGGSQPLELRTISKPRDKRDFKFASNFSKITSTLAVVEQEKATMRLECMVVEKIVQTSRLSSSDE